MQLIRLQVQDALNEDVGHGDITAALIDSNKQLTAHLIAREAAIICGTQWFETAFKLLDEKCTMQWHIKDGETTLEGQVVCDITGNARSILSAERTALNFLQTLSGTATITHQYVNYLVDTNIKLLDTRKTIPGLRAAQKYAVCCGGGFNHRQGLFDGVLIKENHIVACGGIIEALTQVRRCVPHGLKIEIEVETLEQVQQALEARADILLLDNMSMEMIEQTVKLNKSYTTPTAKIEISGDITDKKLQQFALMDIDYISVGSITKHVNAINFSLKFKLDPV